MKKRLIGLLLCIAMTVTAIPMLATAEDNAAELPLDEILGEKKFDDVTDTSWYAEGVYYCVGAGFMSGTSETRFTPHGSMTRAMFVTMLAAYDGADLTEYTGTSFTDVAEGKWYSAAVEWACKNNIVSGIGDGIFGYKNTVNRQEIALMLKTYLEYKGEETQLERTFKYSRYADKDDISSWAEQAMIWACGIGLFDAAGTEGNLPVLKPKNTATRAQVALIMKNFDETLNPTTPVLTIAGNDISLYTIVIAENAAEPQINAASFLREKIAEAYGVELKVVRDNTEPTEYEIIVGKTNREDAGLVSVDRTAEYELTYYVNMQGSRLVIAGTVDAENRRGTLYAAYRVAEEFGYNFLSDYYTVFDGESHDIPADINIDDAPGYQSRSVYWPRGWDEVYNNDSDYYPGCNLTHELAMWLDPTLKDRLGDDAYRLPPCPCLTDEGNIEKIIEYVFNMIKKKPDAQSIWVVHPDNWDHCECVNCSALYDANGGNHSATMVALCNRICEALDEAGYPDFKIMMAAYYYTLTPPTNMVCDDDVIVYYCPIRACIACPYNDKTCPINASIASDIEGWHEICQMLCVWDYSTNFTHLTTPFPDFYNLCVNNNWFYENGVRGAFNNAVASSTADFGDLRAYLLSQLYMSPDMTEQEYFAKMDDFLEAFYGPGWQNVRKYIDLMEEWSSDHHFNCNADPDETYDIKYFEANEDMLNALWDEVEALADTEHQLKYIRRARLNCTYMILNATYYRDYQLGTAESRAEWSALNQQFYNDVVEADIEWGENRDVPAFNPAKPPMEW